MTAAATVGVMLSASSASASPTVGWQPVSTNANWHCTDYGNLTAVRGVKLKTCIVRNANQDAQGVLVVQNTSGHAIEINNVDTQSRVVFESALEGDVWCASTTLNSGFTRGCFGKTVHVGCRATGFADGTLAVRDEGFNWEGTMTKGPVASTC
jgi:hypothetical protein